LVSLKEKLRVRVFENRVLREIFVSEREEVTGWRKLHNAVVSTFFVLFAKCY
jgi:hypothetical protein